jgi:general L-amino acid transport system permease protein
MNTPPSWSGSGLLVFKPRPARPAPRQTVGIIGWLRANLFNGWFNSLFTVIALGLLWQAVPPLLSWAIFDAVWTGGSDACPPGYEGACWAFIFNKFRVLMVGLYPGDLLWRPLLAGGIFMTLAAVTVLRLMKPGILISLWFLLPVAVYWLIAGGLGLTTVDQSLWGGLMLSSGLATIGVLISLPLGILFALGRQSDVAVVKSVCVGIIEPVRGVPLITILFMASVMMPLFLPVGLNINNLLRVQLGIILFSAAYMAEVVRGGLQAISLGQYDAAKSLGLNYWKTTALIVLPQALRHVIPSLIGRCIALFKDTSLVIIVGLLDFLGMVKASAQDPEWLGHDAEAYVFCALVFWVICFSMSRYGRSLERQKNMLSKK